jgi:uncharacterized protein (TIGR02246 family)
MSDDEQAIRALIETWMRTTAAGDLDGVLELMADDVVFLGAGRPPMCGKAAFAAATRAAEGKGRIVGTANVREVRVSGDLAYCWNDLTVVIQPDDGGAETRMTGPSLSIFRRTEAGRWLILRDANMIAPSGRPPA